MRIKHPFHLVIGICCGFIFSANIVKGDDVFMIFVSGLATIVNLSAAFSG